MRMTEAVIPTLKDPFICRSCVFGKCFPMRRAAVRGDQIILPTVVMVRMTLTSPKTTTISMIQKRGFLSQFFHKDNFSSLKVSLMTFEENLNLLLHMLVRKGRFVVRKTLYGIPVRFEVWSHLRRGYLLRWAVQIRCEIRKVPHVGATVPGCSGRWLRLRCRWKAQRAPL